MKLKKNQKEKKELEMQFGILMKKRKKKVMILKKMKKPKQKKI